MSNEGKGQRGQTYLKVWCGQMYLQKKNWRETDMIMRQPRLVVLIRWCFFFFFCNLDGMRKKNYMKCDHCKNLFFFYMPKTCSGTVVSLAQLNL